MKLVGVIDNNVRDEQLAGKLEIQFGQAYQPKKPIIQWGREGNGEEVGNEKRGVRVRWR